MSKSIFVTVGTDLPFDRLVKAIDEWAPLHTDFEVFAQIGETEWQPQNIEFGKFLEPPLFKERFRAADLIISHAGMGTILSSLQFQKPLLVMPRKASLGEHRNEHQLATAKYLKSLDKVNVVNDEDDLKQFLDSFESIKPRPPIGPHASPSLTSAIRNFIQS